MQQACHTRAITGCEDQAPLLRAEASAECLKIRRFSGLQERGTKLMVSARATRHGRPGTSAHQGSAGAIDYRTFVGHRRHPRGARRPGQRAFAGSLLTAFRCSVNMHAGGALLTRIACFFTNDSMPPRPPRPENLKDSHSAAP